MSGSLSEHGSVIDGTGTARLHGVPVRGCMTPGLLKAACRLPALKGW